MIKAWEVEAKLTCFRRACDFLVKEAEDDMVVEHRLEERQFGDHVR